MDKLPVYIAKRYLLLLAGLSIMAFGVAFSIKASLGTSPISSVPYVVSLFAPLTVGTATIVMHCVFILLQILILRRNYHPIQLMQLPVAVFFGYLTDFGVWAVRGIHCSTYWQQWIVCLIGILLVAAGVSLEVKAGVVVLAGEGVVLAICKVLPKIKFGYMKVGFDVTLVVIACILSFTFTGHLQGVREGTVAAALLVGLIAKQIGKLLMGWKLEGEPEKEKTAG
ncbi:MAG TPA: YitT family protein [Candidatus Mediterraneibacter norwichensis]|nr:YitT family protein [Candidatus Mediterraneibacter norwichensis]